VVDLEHDTPEVVADGVYGEVVEIMKKPMPIDTGVPQ
jgi:hypothetical protein